MSDAPVPTVSPSRPSESLVDVLDGLLDTGVVADAQVVVSVAGVDLIYIGLRALLASMDTAARMSLAPLEHTIPTSTAPAHSTPVYRTQAPMPSGPAAS